MRWLGDSKRSFVVDRCRGFVDKVVGSEQAKPISSIALSLDQKLEALKTFEGASKALDEIQDPKNGRDLKGIDHTENP